MKYIYILLCLIFVMQMSAQKINKDYIFYSQEKGNLYFIFPQKGFTSQEEIGIKGLVYDITYLASSDSITFSCTYFDKEINKSETITFLSFDNQVIYEGEARMLFVQPFKSCWKHRATIHIPYAKAIQFYDQELPCRLLLHANKKDIQYQIAQKKWQKQRYLINRIFEIILNNN